MLGVRRLAVVLLVVVLAVGDAALVRAALQRSHRSDPSAAARSAAAADAGALATTATPVATPTASVAASTGRQSGAQVVAAPGERGLLLTTSDGTTAWRAHGGCSATPTLSMTTDGARSWTPLTAPAPHLLRIDLTGAGVGWAVGVNAACASPTFYTTGDAGTTWTAAASLGTVWLPLRAGVLTPTGHTTAPCGRRTAPVDLAPSGSSDALVICPTGVERTTDGGSTWTPTGRVPAGDAVGVSIGQPDAAVLVLTGAPHCGGLRVLTSTDTGGSWTKGPCLTGAVAPASVALTAAGSGLLVSAGRSYTTTDAGRSWS